MFQVSPVFAWKMNERQESLQRSILSLHEGLFTDSAGVFFPAGTAAEVPLPALQYWHADKRHAVTTLQLRLQLRHQHQAIIGNTAACRRNILEFIILLNTHWL